MCRGVTLAKQKMSDRQRVTAAVQTGSNGSSVPQDSQALRFLFRDQEIGVHTSADLLESALGSVSCKHARCATGAQGARLS